MTATNQQDQEQKEDGDENGLDLAGESEVGQGEGTGKRKGDVAPTEAAPPPPPPEPVNGDLGRTNGEMVKSEEDGNDDKKKNDDDDDEGDAREKRIVRLSCPISLLLNLTPYSGPILLPYYQYYTTISGFGSNRLSFFSSFLELFLFLVIFRLRYG